MKRTGTSSTGKLEKRNGKRALSSRIPRIGKVVFAEEGNPVHCTVREFSTSSATITMTGWLGLPSEFTLYVEPDSIRAQCKVLGRKGNNIQVEFTRIDEEIRFRSTALSSMAMSRAE